VAPELRISHPAEGVGLLLFADPPKNFLSASLGERMEQAVVEIRESGARVIVVASDTPGYFIAHMALDEVLAMNEGRKLEGDVAAIARCAQELRRGPMVSIAVNHGQAWGGGCELFATANLRMAGESATFGQPESLFGLMAAGGGTSRLPRVIGETRACEMLLDGRPISARKALHWGLVNRVEPDDRLRDAAIAWAAWIASRPASALAAAKRSILSGLDRAAFRDAVAREADIHAALLSTDREDRRRRTHEGHMRYQAGADSFEAWGLDPSDVQDWD